MAYRAPVADVAFMLKEVAGLDALLADGAFPELDSEMVDAVLEEAGKFATEVLAPLNRVGDLEPPVLEGGAITTPPGWREAYAKWIESGWSTLTADPEFGGQGLPVAVLIAVGDLWNQANSAFAINPLLTSSAVEALQAHGSDALKATYLPKLVTGAWAGTMNLTEPQAGSDLAALKTRAEPAGDGTYRITGQKIFITYGEHDLTENIVHLVLARLPDAPAGTRGISLFLVPKFIPNEDGTLGDRNDVRCAGLEHKLGLHGSPTCTMVYGDEGGATGWLVGEENRGLACMFTMMNNARLGVGLQGAAIAERATQQAILYANERLQGRAKSFDGDGMAPIVHHPDVRRMLMTMRAMTDAARAICYACAVALDRAAHGENPAFWKARADLLTPVAKAFSTDVGVEVASIGVQVHGGMGYIEETGAAQYLRDARIFPIYEGTNGIQAIDLVTRKVPMADGAVVCAFLDEMRAIAENARGANDVDLGDIGARLSEAIDDLAGATEAVLGFLADGAVEDALAGAAAYLRAFGLTAGGSALTRAVLLARNGGGSAGAQGKAGFRLATARFFADHHLGQVASLARTVRDGGQSLAAATPEMFAV